MQEMEGRRYKTCYEAAYYLDTWSFIALQNSGSQYRIHTRGVRDLGYLSTNPHQSLVEGTLGGVNVLVYLPCPALGRTGTTGQRESESKALQVLTVGS